jgi:hypothetical protein
LFIRDSAVLKLIVFGVVGFTAVFLNWGGHPASQPGVVMMGGALIGLILVLDLPGIVRSNSSMGLLLTGLDQSIARGDHYRAEELLNVARRPVGIGTSQMHIHLDLAEGKIMFREGRYDEAYSNLERCFLHAFAANDAKHGGESGLLLLKTLVAMGRYKDACDFALGVRELSDSPEIENLVALASNRMASNALVTH